MKIILSILFAVAITRCGASPASNDFNANTEAAVSALQRWYNSNGLWDTTGWWNAANCVDALADAIAVNNDRNYIPVLQNTFNLNSGGDFLNDYYDDEGWWVEAWLRAYDLTGNVQYLKMAKTIFSDMTNAWDSHCEGGIWWSTSRTYKNAIPNELFLLDAIRLHQRTPGDGGAGSYYEWAVKEWTWFKNSGMINSRNLVNDGLTYDCSNNGRTTWSYNQGVILGALTDFFKVTGNTNYLTQAETIATATLASLVDQTGVLQEFCRGRRCGGRDVPQFKGIFIRNLAYLYDVDHKPDYFNFLFLNARAVWLNDRNSSNQFGFKWGGPFDVADAACQSSAVMPLSVLAEPATALLSFAKGAADCAFSHSAGSPAGNLRWTCGPMTPAGLIQYGPSMASLPTGLHSIHFRLTVSALSNANSNLVQLSVTENNHGTTLAVRDVPWNLFVATNEAQDFSLDFTNAVAGDPLEFRIY